MFKLRIQETLCSEARVLRGSEPSGCPLSKKIDDKVVHRKWIFTSDMAKKTRKICLITVCWIQFISGKLALWKNVETNLPIPHHSAFSNDPAVELSPANSVYWAKSEKGAAATGLPPLWHHWNHGNWIPRIPRSPKKSGEILRFSLMLN